MSFFASALAQSFGYRLQTQGLELLEEAIAPPHGCQNAFLAACEVLARATGAFASDQFWCASAHKWLSETKYNPSHKLIEVALSNLATLHPATDTSSLRSSLETRSSKKLVPKFKPLSVPALKKLLKQTHGDKAECFQSGGELTIGVNGKLQVATMIALSYLSQEFTLVVDFLNHLPNAEDVEALRCLMIGSKDNLVGIYFQAEHRSAIKRAKDPHKILTHCTTELSDLRKLSDFRSSRMYVDDQVLESIAKSKQLRVLSAAPSLDVTITSKAVPTLAECKDLTSVIIDSKFFSETEARDLASRFPTLNMSTGSFTCGFE